ncbi:ubiquitin carboxyl-terminal hydrolase 12-like [Neltuma alba]|uniref:ubiquitin carboxyl-terminal hydrolase 12-like n=1 Tax=Neltuma alba TaxID=207710 RepID=UPI0010A37152|nr:ubiquitin carboxyl-terminal hydrolase 12-like [Prosopis alba]
MEPTDILVTSKKIAWTIGNFSSLKTNAPHYSDPFTAGHCSWKVAIYRGLEDEKYLGIFLCVADTSTLPQGWSIDAHLTIMVINQISSQKSYAKGLRHKFRASERVRGFRSFMDLTELQDPSSGYILNDYLTVEVEFLELKSESVQPSLLANPTDDEALSVDFKDLAQIERPWCHS